MCHGESRLKVFAPDWEGKTPSSLWSKLALAFLLLSILMLCCATVERKSCLVLTITFQQLPHCIRYYTSRLEFTCLLGGHKAQGLCVFLYDFFLGLCGFLLGSLVFSCFLITCSGMAKPRWEVRRDECVSVGHMLPLDRLASRLLCIPREIDLCLLGWSSYWRWIYEWNIRAYKHTVCMNVEQTTKPPLPPTSSWVLAGLVQYAFSFSPDNWIFW